MTKWPLVTRLLGLPQRVCNEIERLAASTPLSVRQIHETIEGKASRSIVGAIVKRVRATPAAAP